MSKMTVTDLPTIECVCHRLLVVELDDEFQCPDCKRWYMCCPNCQAVHPTNEVREKDRGGWECESCHLTPEDIESIKADEAYHSQF